jgi:hypothetical protein
VATYKVSEVKRKDIYSSTQISVSVGQNGFEKIPFEIKEIKPQHNICFIISVLQPSGRTDLDIGFSVMDEDNYEKWLLKQPSSAYIIAPRFKFGTIAFMPSNVGRYYAVLDNRYSILTGKTIMFGIYETWKEEKELIVPIAQKTVEKVEKPKPIRDLLRRFWNRLHSSRAVGLISLLIAVQVICVFLAIGIAMLLHFTLGVQYADTMGYIATAIGGSAVVILFSLYFLLTGRSLPQISPQS